jgi:RecA/RadA recombinase
MSYWNPLIHKIRTPIQSLNIAGCGGLEWGTMTECWGEPRGGKSTLAYQCASLLLEDYGDDVNVLILDSEGAANLLRIGKVFNLWPCNLEYSYGEKDERVFIEKAMTFEMATEAIGKYISKSVKENKFLFVIWDSIKNSISEVEYEQAMEVFEKDLRDSEDIGGKNDKDGLKNYAGGQMSSSRFLALNLRKISAAMAYKPVHVFLINQATTKIGKYTSTVDSGGGFGLKHGISYRFHVQYMSDLDESEFFKKGTHSKLHVGKSRLMPSLQNIPITIRDNLGGKISNEEELVLMAKEYKWLKLNGAWYSANFPKELVPEGVEVPDIFSGNKRFSQYVESSEAINYLSLIMEKFLRKEFFLVDEAYKEREAIEGKSKPKKSKKTEDVDHEEIVVEEEEETQPVKRKYTKRAVKKTAKGKKK